MGKRVEVVRYKLEVCLGIFFNMIELFFLGMKLQT
jgi:hypothetical protein